MPDPAVSVWGGQLRAAYSVSQPSEPPHEVLEEAAIAALQAEGQKLINTWNQAPLPEKFVFYAVLLDQMVGEWAATHTNPITQERSWSGGGTAVGRLEYTFSPANGAMEHTQATIREQRMAFV